MREKEELLIIDVDNTDFSSRARGDSCDVPPSWYSTSVDRKHSSHCAYTRGVTVSKSSMADRIVNCCAVDSIFSNRYSRQSVVILVPNLEKQKLTHGS